MMKLTLLSSFAFLLCYIGLAQDNKMILPDDPVVAAKYARVDAMIDEALHLVRRGDTPSAFAKLQEAIDVEKTLRAFCPLARLARARLLVREKRDNEALDAYHDAFLWDSREKTLLGADLTRGLVSTQYCSPDLERVRRRKPRTTMPCMLLALQVTRHHDQMSQRLFWPSSISSRREPFGTTPPNGSRGPH